MASGEPFANEYGDDEYMYPQLSRVVMRRLEVNSEAPAPGSLESQWMSEDGEYVGPSSVRHDAFSIRPATMTALRAYRWPRDMRPLITTHIGELGTLIRLTRAGAASARVRRLGPRWLAEAQAATRTTRATRRALHLPDRDPVG